MELTILGTNSPYPREGRATLGYAIKHDGPHLLLETGFGIYRRLLEEGLLNGIQGVALSHLHADHAADLPAVVLGLTVGQDRQEPIPLYLPAGEGERLRQWLAACGFGFVLEHLALHELVFGRPVPACGMQLTMSPAQHSLPAGIITLAAAGKRFVYSGDTGDCPALRQALAGADLALAEAAGLPPEVAAAKGHLPAALLGEIARAAGVKQLVVTHFMQGSDPEALARETAAAFGASVARAEEGKIFTV